MTDIVERLHVVRDHLRTGRFGQREAWEEWLTEAADEIKRLRALLEAKITPGYELLATTLEKMEADNERLQGIEQFVTEAARHERDGLRAEIDRLRTQCGGNCRYWEGRWRDEKADNDRLRAALATKHLSIGMWKLHEEAAAEIDRLRAALQALHDHDVEYARINNLFNGDGTPATFHELLQARAALEPKP